MKIPSIPSKTQKIGCSRNPNTSNRRNAKMKSHMTMSGTSPDGDCARTTSMLGSDPCIVNVTTLDWTAPFAKSVSFLKACHVALVTFPDIENVIRVVVEDDVCDHPYCLSTLHTVNVGIVVMAVVSEFMIVNRVTAMAP